MALLKLPGVALAGNVNLNDEYLSSIAAMSRSGAAVRDSQAIRELYGEVRGKLAGFAAQVRIASEKELPLYYRYRDILLCQAVYLYAMMDYADKGGKSRGAALYTAPKGEKALDCLPDSCRLALDDGALRDSVQEVRWREGDIACEWRAVRPIPEVDDFFENVWREYRESENVY